MTTTAITPLDLARILEASTEYKLNANDLHCLCVISAAGADALTMNSTAAAMKLSSAAITGIADKLESAGFITRRTARVDRRVIWLEITERGNHVLADILNSAS